MGVVFFEKHCIQTGFNKWMRPVQFQHLPWTITQLISCFLYSNCVVHLKTQLKRSFWCLMPLLMHFLTAIHQGQQHFWCLNIKGMLVYLISIARKESKRYKKASHGTCLWAEYIEEGAPQEVFYKGKSAWNYEATYVTTNTDI